MHSWRDHVEFGHKSRSKGRSTKELVSNRCLFLVCSTVTRASVTFRFLLLFIPLFLSFLTLKRKEKKSLLVCKQVSGLCLFCWSYTSSVVVLSRRPFHLLLTGIKRENKSVGIHSSLFLSRLLSSGTPSFKPPSVALPLSWIFDSISSCQPAAEKKAEMAHSPWVTCIYKSGLLLYGFFIIR